MSNKVKKHKVASIVLPVVGGAALVAGVTAGVVVAVNNNADLAVEETKLVLDKNTKKALLKVKINDDVKDGLVFAYIDNKDMKSSNSNDVEVSAVVFQDTKETHSKYTLNRNELSAPITIDNLPTLKGKYVYDFNVTLVYNNNEDKEIRRELTNLSLTFELDKDYVDITDPSPEKRHISYKFEDETNAGVIPVKGFSYHGEIDETNFSVLVGNAKQIADDTGGMGVSATVKLNKEKKTFETDITVNNGYGMKNLIVRLDFYYHGEVVHTTNVVLDLIEAETITYTADAFDSGKMHWNGSSGYVMKNVDGTLTLLAFEKFGFTGWIDDAKDAPEQLPVRLKPTFENKNTNYTVKSTVYNVNVDDKRHKTFDVEFEITFVDANLLKNKKTELTNLISFKFDDKEIVPEPTDPETQIKGKLIGSDTSYTLALSEGNTITAPDHTAAPEYIKIKEDVKTNGFILNDAFVLSGFKYTGFDETIDPTLLGSSITLPLSTQNPKTGLTESFTINGTIMNVKDGKFDIRFAKSTPLVGNLTIDSIGINSTGASGNVDFNSFGDGYVDFVYYQAKETDYFKNIKLYWADWVDAKDFGKIDSKRFDDEGKISDTLTEIQYRGFETEEQRDNSVFKVEGTYTSKTGEQVDITTLPEGALSVKVAQWGTEPDTKGYMHLSASVDFQLQELAEIGTTLKLSIKMEHKNPSQVVGGAITVTYIIHAVDKIFDVTDETQKSQPLDLHNADAQGVLKQTISGFQFTGFDTNTEKERLVVVPKLYSSSGVAQDVTVTLDTEHEGGAFNWHDPSAVGTKGTLDVNLKFTFPDRYKRMVITGSIEFYLDSAETGKLLLVSSGYNINVTSDKAVIDEDVEKAPIDATLDSTGSAIVKYTGFTFKGMTYEELDNLTVAATGFKLTESHTGTFGTATIHKNDATSFDVWIPITGCDPFASHTIDDTNSKLTFTYTNPGATSGFEVGTSTGLGGTINLFGNITESGTASDRTVTFTADESRTVHAVFQNFGYTGFTTYKIEDLTPVLTTTDTPAVTYTGKIVNATANTFSVQFDIDNIPLTGKTITGQLSFKIDDTQYKAFTNDYKIVVEQGYGNLVEPIIKNLGEIKYSAAERTIVVPFHLDGNINLANWDIAAAKIGTWAGQAYDQTIQVAIDSTSIFGSFFNAKLTVGTLDSNEYKGGFQFTFTNKTQTTESFTLKTADPADSYSFKIVPNEATGIDVGLYDVTTTPVAVQAITVGQQNLSIRGNISGDGELDKNITFALSGDCADDINPIQDTDIIWTDNYNYSVPLTWKQNPTHTGSLTITASTASGLVKNSVSVNVYEAHSGILKIEGISATEALFIGESVQAKAYFGDETDPATDIDWTSSETDVATIDAEGNIYPKAAGQTTIKATWKAVQGTYAEVLITVKAKPASISEFALSKEKIFLSDTDKTATVSINLVDINGNSITYAKQTDAITLDSSDTTKATVAPDASGNYKITAVAAGTVTITATAKDNSLVTASVQLEVVAAHTLSFDLSDDEVLPEATVTIENLKKDGVDLQVTDCDVTSSKTSVATVDSTTKEITAVGLGETTITVTNNGLSAEKTLKVSAAQIVGLSCSLSSPTVVQGTTVDITNVDLTDSTGTHQSIADVDQAEAIDVAIISVGTLATVVDATSEHGYQIKAASTGTGDVTIKVSSKQNENAYQILTLQVVSQPMVHDVFDVSQFNQSENTIVSDTINSGSGGYHQGVATIHFNVCSEIDFPSLTSCIITLGGSSNIKYETVSTVQIKQTETGNWETLTEGADASTGDYHISADGMQIILHEEIYKNLSVHKTMKVTTTYTVPASELYRTVVTMAV